VGDCAPKRSLPRTLADNLSVILTVSVPLAWPSAQYSPWLPMVFDDSASHSNPCNERRIALASACTQAPDHQKR
jgi:hypothetical protein